MATFRFKNPKSGSTPASHPMQLNLSEQSAFEVVFDTAHAYRFSLADWLIGQLTFLSPKQKETIKLCLHEAVSNAILHGNLQVGSQNGNTSSFLQVQELTMHRLEDPDYANRKITLRCEYSDDVLSIEVEDEGKGFNLKQALERNLKSPYPRGLAMIQRFTHHMSLHKRGKCIRMEFSLNAKA